MDSSRRDTLKALGVAGAAVALPSTAAVADEPRSVQPGDTAAARVAHASPDAPRLDVSVDGRVVFEGVAYGAATEYVSLDAGSHAVRITPAGGGATAFEAEVSLDGGRAYTIAAVNDATDGPGGGNGPGTPDDTPTATPDDGGRGPGVRAVVLADYGFAHLRLFHASPDAPTVDATLANDVPIEFTAVAFGDSTDYAAVPAGDYALEVRPAEDDGGGTVATADVSVVPGGVYTAVAGGYLDPANAPADVEFSVTLVPDVAFADADLSAVWTGDGTATPGGNAPDPP